MVSPNFNSFSAMPMAGVLGEKLAYGLAVGVLLVLSSYLVLGGAGIIKKVVMDSGDYLDGQTFLVIIIDDFARTLLADKEAALGYG